MLVIQEGLIVWIIIKIDAIEVAIWQSILLCFYGQRSFAKIRAFERMRETSRGLFLEITTENPH